MFKEEKLFYLMITELINNELFNNIDSDLIDIIKKHENKKNTLENKINNLESEYLSNIEEIKKYCNENIIFENCNSLELLSKELKLIKIILKYSLSNNELEVNILENSLKYLLNISDTLKKRLNQSDLELTENNELSRCSYKFCTFKENCNYFYNKKSSNKCYQDHYVHNMVSHDINILLKFIKNNHENQNKIKQNKDILKTLNTLSYVISHMESELKAKCIYLEEKEWIAFHN